MNTFIKFLAIFLRDPGGMEVVREPDDEYDSAPWKLRVRFGADYSSDTPVFFSDAVADFLVREILKLRAVREIAAEAVADATTPAGSENDVP